MILVIRFIGRLASVAKTRGWKQDQLCAQCGGVVLVEWSMQVPEAPGESVDEVAVGFDAAGHEFT